MRDDWESLQGAQEVEKECLAPWSLLRPPLAVSFLTLILSPELENP